MARVFYQAPVSRNLQEIFDIVAPNLIRQNKKSVNKHGNCKLRGIDGTKCALGWLLPDPDYVEYMEQGALGYFLDEEEWDGTKECPLDILKSDRAKFLDNLRYIHDALRVDEWHTNLCRLAGTYHLNTTCIDSLINFTEEDDGLLQQLLPE